MLQAHGTRIASTMKQASGLCFFFFIANSSSSETLPRPSAEEENLEKTMFFNVLFLVDV